MNYTPRLSVIITTFRSLDYLKLCLESIIEGGVTLPEMVVYADGSPPETHDYLQDLMIRLRSRRRGVQLVFQGEMENVGITRATNRAARLASGDWLYFVNDDMVFAPGFDAALLKHAGPNRVLTGTVVEPERPNLGVAPVHLKRDFGLWAKDFDAARWAVEAPSLAEDRVEPGINYPFCVESELFWEIDGIDERFTGPMHDPDLFYRLQLAGAEMLRVRDSLCYHFSGRSLRFEGEKQTVSPRWIEQETAGKLAFLQKWGEKPNYRFGGVPRPGVTSPNARRRPMQHVEIALRTLLYKTKARKQMKGAADSV